MPRIVIPGLAEARAAERQSREAAFLCDTETVAGVELRALTAADCLVLEAAGSPFLCGGPIGPEHVAQFLWAQSVDYAPDLKARARFLKRIAGLPFGATATAISAHVDESFADAPNGGGGPDAAATSWIAALVDLFGEEYGWTPQVTTREPLRRLWQYLRRIQLRRNPKAVLFNPSDRVVADWLAKSNAPVNAN